MIFPKVWLVVKPGVGFPLLLSGVAVSALAIHIGVLTQTNIFSDYWNGRPITTTGAAVAELAPTASADDVALLK